MASSTGFQGVDAARVSREFRVSKEQAEVDLQELIEANCVHELIWAGTTYEPWEYSPDRPYYLDCREDSPFRPREQAISQMHERDEAERKAPAQPHVTPSTAPEPPIKLTRQLRDSDVAKFIKRHLHLDPKASDSALLVQSRYSPNCDSERADPLPPAEFNEALEAEGLRLDGAKWRGARPKLGRELHAERQAAARRAA
jgi:hypothetical protein